MASKGKRTAGKAPATREYKSFKFELESADESGAVSYTHLRAHET